jgi:FkbM family methyltransferase
VVTELGMKTPGRGNLSDCLVLQEGAIMATTSETLADLLGPDRLTSVVDIGANPIDGDLPYKPMLQRRLCRLTGFEPQPEALAELNSRKSDLETDFPYVVSDGKKHTLRVCGAPGMTSLLEERGRAVRGLPITTRRLDDIKETGAIHFLKMDVQGSELSIFRRREKAPGENRRGSGQSVVHSDLQESTRLRRDRHGVCASLGLRRMHFQQSMRE